MHKNILIFATIIIAVSIIFYGFSCAPKTEEQKTADTLEQIMSKAQRLNEFSYDVYTTDPQGNQMVIKMYIKGTKMRQESEIQGQKTIILGDSGGIMYTYSPSQNTAIKLDVGAQTEELESDPYEAVNEIMSTAKIVGHETIDGKNCVVVEYAMADTEYGFTQKMWIWEKYGIPVKIVTITSEGTTTMEYKNIQTSGITDDLFELPPGVNVVDLESMMQGGGLDPEALKALQGLTQ